MTFDLLCPTCKLADVSYERTCHNSSCELYADSITVYEGWNHPPIPSSANAGNIIVNGEEWVPLEAYREAMNGWKAANATPEVVDGTAGLVAALEAVEKEGLRNHSTRCRSWWSQVLTALSQHRG